MNSNKKIIKWSAAIVIALVVVIGFFATVRYKKSAEPGLVAQIGDYKIFQSDIGDEIGFQKCLNHELDPTRALGILAYTGFLESVKVPLKTDVAQADIDKEYNALETSRTTSFMSVDAKALACLNSYFSGKRASFDKIVILQPLLEASVQKAFAGPIANNPSKNIFGTNETFYDWYTGYLKSNVKVEIYSPQVCSDVKSLYGDAWFNSIISC